MYEPFWFPDFLDVFHTFSTPAERIEAFRQRLLRSGLVAMTRKTRGEEIDAACGQLVGRVEERTRHVVAFAGAAGSRVS